MNDASLGPKCARLGEVLSRVLLEDDDDPWLSRLGSRRDEVPREERLARSRRPHEERRSPRRNPAGHHRIQRRDARRRALGGLPERARLGARQDPREDADTVRGNQEGVEARHRGACAHLRHLHPAHARAALEALGEPDDAVGDREDGVAMRFDGLVLADEKRRRLPAGQMKRQSLHELLELRLGPARVRDCAKRVDDDHRGLDLFDFGKHAFHDAAEIVVHRFGAEIHEPDRSAHLLLVEEAVLLHVPQHLERRLAQHSEIDRRRFRRSSREDDLLRQRALASAGPPGDQVERVLGQTAA